MESVRLRGLRQAQVFYRRRSGSSEGTRRPGLYPPSAALPTLTLEKKIYSPAAAAVVVGVVPDTQVSFHHMFGLLNMLSGGGFCG